MTIQIKQATMDDLTSIAYLFDKYRVFYKKYSDLTLATDFIRARIINNESVIFYAVNQSKEYLGFVQLYPSFSSVSAVKIWVLNDLYVTGSERKKGVASALIMQVEEFAISTNAKRINLETAEDNLQAQKLYESLGYTRESGAYYYHELTE